MSIVKIPFCYKCGVPHVPEDIAERVRAGEEITVDIISKKGVAVNVLEYGTGAINIDASRISTTDKLSIGSGRMGYHGADGSNPGIQHTQGRFPANTLFSHTIECRQIGVKRVAIGGGRPIEGNERQSKNVYNGLVKKNSSTYHGDEEGLETVEAWECAPYCPIRLLDEQTKGTRAEKPSASGLGGWRNQYVGGDTPAYYRGTSYHDSGGASRYFQTFQPTEDDYAPFAYFSKPSRRERNLGCEGLPEKQTFDKNTSKQIAHINHNTGNVTYNEYTPSSNQNSHPTVKPLALCRYLIRMITPPGGVVLDMFAGSGSIPCGAILEGMNFIAIEQEPDYVEIIKARTRYYLAEMEAA